MDLELQTCPFCGGEARAYGKLVEPHHPDCRTDEVCVPEPGRRSLKLWIKCSNCDARSDEKFAPLGKVDESVPNIVECLNQLVTNWNHRVGQD